MKEPDETTEEVIAVPSSELDWLRLQVKNVIQPMVPYKMDELEFCQEAHRVKNETARGILNRFGKYWGEPS